MRQFAISGRIGDTDSSHFNTYLNESGKVKPLTPQEEFELFKKIKSGDETAADHLIKANLRFVVSVAKQYQNKGLAFPDLVGEGNIGLIRAIKNFDETRGFKFISYAIRRIRASIQQALEKNGRLIKVPRKKYHEINKTYNTTADLMQLLGRDPTAEEIATCLDLEERIVLENIAHDKLPSSLDRELSDENESTLLNITPDTTSDSTDSKLMRESENFEIEKRLSFLSRREAQIVKLFFGLCNNDQLTCKEIANVLNLNHNRVSCILKNALIVLRRDGRPPIY